MRLRRGGGAGNSDNQELAALKQQLEQQEKDRQALAKQLEEQKEATNAAMQAGGADTASIEAKRQMEEMLKKKAMEMSAMLDMEGPAVSAQDAALQQQKKEYGARGISLAALEGKSQLPHFINIDLDPFRNKRFMFFVKENGETKFGKDGDVKPFSLTDAEHCVVTAEIVNDEPQFTLKGIADETYHNGKLLDNNGAAVSLGLYDRVMIGSEKLLFIVPKKITEGSVEPDAATITKEMEEASRTDEQRALEEKMRKFEEMKAQWESQQKDGKANDADAEEKQKELSAMAMELVNKEILDLLPKTKQSKILCYELNRDILGFEVSMQRGSQDTATPTVKVRVTKTDTKEIILIDSFEYTKGNSTLRDEHTRIKLALENDREYHSPLEHEPILLFMNYTTQYGSAIIFPEYLQYMLETEEEERYVAIKSAMALDQNVGKLEVVWTPLASPDDPDSAPSDDMFNDSPEELLGKEWTYKIEIRGASGLELMCSKAYVEYRFFGEKYQTLTIEEDTSAPTFNYMYVHHVPSVTQEFLDFLDKPMDFIVYAAPFIKTSGLPPPSSVDPVIVSRITGRAMDTPTVDKMDLPTLRAHATKIEKQLAEKDSKIQSLTEKVSELTKMLQARTAEVEKLKGGSGAASKVAGAVAADAAVNGD